MPTPPLRENLPKMQAALDAWTAENENYPAGARRLGIKSVATFRHQVNTALAEGLIPFKPPPKPRIRVPARTTGESGKPIRVLVWGCAHDAPDLPDKSRFRNAGLLAAELNSDYIVDLGDSLDLDSLSRHPVPGSQDDRDRPYFKAEIASLDEAYAAFNDAAPPPDQTPRYHLHGNHEQRAWKYESMNPSSQGVFTTEIDQVFARYGFSIKNWSEWLFLGDVGFVHAPLNIMGREYGGKQAENTILNETTYSVVWSHTHRHHFARRPKIGSGNWLASYNTGSMMPQGFVKAYARLATTGWSYGVSELTLRDGQIESARYWSVLELQERYS